MREHALPIHREYTSVCDKTTLGLGLGSKDLSKTMIFSRSQEEIHFREFTFETLYIVAPYIQSR